MFVGSFTANARVTALPLDAPLEGMDSVVPLGVANAEESAAQTHLHFLENYDKQN